MDATSTEAADTLDIRLRNVSKRFGSLWANREISLDILRGEIHAIVGENGAGKSTLMKLLHGHFRPDSGTIALSGVPVRFKSPRQASEAGLGMVNQQPFSFPQFTALENIVVGYPPGGHHFLKLRDRRATVEALCGLFGFEVPLDRRAGELAFAHRQQIELLRVLYRGARVLILDEPTSLLAPPEVEKLLDLLRTLRARQHTILFVSHRLSEGFNLADRVSILSKGRCMGTFQVSEISRGVVARLIEEGGRGGEPEGVRGESYSSDPPLQSEERRVAVRLDGIRVSPTTDEIGLNHLSLGIAEGECLGIGGVVGNGQRSLARLLAGTVRAAEGTIRMAGEDITQMPMRERRMRGLRWLPANPAEEAVLPDGSLVDNYLLGSHRDDRFQWHGWLRRTIVSRWAAAALDEAEVRFEGLAFPARSLSGGNLQKLAICRALEGKPCFVVLEQPMRGLDIRGQERLRARLRRFQTQGVAFLVISHDLDELFLLCDRIGILFGGKLMGVQHTVDARRERLIQWMLGGL
jgi:general nucleoside transport system ATP-binding protein